MKKELLSLLPCCVPLAVQAAPVTYAFSGTVINATGIYATAGSTISGTYTIDLAAADPAASAGVLGSTTDTWIRRYLGGMEYGTPLPSGLVFSSTLTSGGVTYATPPIGGIGLETFVRGLGTPPTTYEAYHRQTTIAGNYVTSIFDLTAAPGSAIVFDAAGLPLLGNAISATGQLLSVDGGTFNGVLDYTITTLSVSESPVPLPAAAWLMLSGVGGLGALSIRRTHRFASAR
jgi:hypothetical protein